MKKKNNTLETPISANLQYVNLYRMRIYNLKELYFLDAT